MERPTKTIKTPVEGKEIVLKEWITGRENEYIAGPMFDTINMSAPAGQPEVNAGNFSKQIEEGNHRAITTVIVSIDGSVDDILNKALDMIHDDYEFILTEIEKVTKKKDAKPKS
jgi:hypothetical protein